MQLSQPTLEPHSLCYICWVQVVYSHLPSLLFYSLWDVFDCCSVPGDVEDYISGLDDFWALSPSWRPYGTLFFMYLFYASAFLELVLDSVVIKIFIYNFYAFIRDTCCDILMILLYICVTWSWRIYDCSIYVLINRVWHWRGLAPIVPISLSFTSFQLVFYVAEGVSLPYFQYNSVY
jgi:hypothetical protein